MRPQVFVNALSRFMFPSRACLRDVPDGAIGTAIALSVAVWSLGMATAMEELEKSSLTHAERASIRTFLVAVHCEAESLCRLHGPEVRRTHGNVSRLMKRIAHLSNAHLVCMTPIN